MYLRLPRLFKCIFVASIKIFFHDFQIISPILRALADENEFVRETAYKVRILYSLFTMNDIFLIETKIYNPYTNDTPAYTATIP